MSALIADPTAVSAPCVQRAAAVLCVARHADLPTCAGRFRLHVRVVAGRQHRLRAGHQADGRDGDGDGRPRGRRAVQVVHGALRPGLPGSQVGHAPGHSGPPAHPTGGEESGPAGFISRGVARVSKLVRTHFIPIGLDLLPLKPGGA